MIMNRLANLSAGVILLVATVCVADVDPAATLVLTNATLIDGTGRPAVRNVTVEITGELVGNVYVGDYAVNDENSPRLVDLQGAFLMPGLWNNHSHLADLLPDPKNTLGEENSYDATIRAGRNALDYLRAGFTSLRVVG
jgi:imidazolonepropionase-like amidohydrolase